MLSCGLGLPCLVPFDSLEIKPGEESALPPDFIAKLRIALYVSRINHTLGHNTSKDSRTRIKMVRLIEKDLDRMVSGFRQSPAKWNPTVEFVHLGVLLNLYSFCLRGTPTVSLSDPDYTIIQSSAANAACRLVDIYATSPLCTDGTSPSLESRPQRYHSKFYTQFNTITLLMLLKISALNQISLRELGEVEDAIRTGHGALMASSTSHGDESHRAAAMVEVLCKKGVIESATGDSPVESRFGASMWLELLATGIRWRRRNSVVPKNRVHGNIDNVSPGRSVATSSTTSIRPAAVSESLPVPVSPASGDNIDAARLALANLPVNIDIFPFSIED